MSEVRAYFGELYGNDSVKVRLGKAIENGTLPHAFLFVGQSGSGKKTLASLLAMALNCEKKDDRTSPLPCGTCNTCRRIREGNFTDIARLKRSDGKATVGVDEVRLFREDMFLSPTESSCKVYVIEDAECLTPNAQNALLTVLEEPPTNVAILLLATEGDKILTTIKSRAQLVSMQRFDASALKRYLVGKNERASLLSRTDEEALDGILMSADGRIGQALALLSEKDAKESQAERETATAVIDALLPGKSYAELYSAISRLPSQRTEFREALELIMTALRDLTLIKFDETAPLLFYVSRDEAKRIAGELSAKKLLTVYDLVKDALDDAGRNVGVSAISADLSVKIKLI